MRNKVLASASKLQIYTMKHLKPFPLELLFWSLALVLLATSNANEHHFTLCPLANLGFNWCPGCGLGRAITALFKGEVLVSIKHHWLGIPALALILHRIYQLSQPLFHKKIKI